MDSPQESLLNKLAKITILTEFVIKDGKVLEITSEHHLIETSDKRVIEVKNDHIIKIEPRRIKKYDSRC